MDYCYNDTLVGICDVGWTEEDAVVACRTYGQRYRKIIVAVFICTVIIVFHYSK